MSDIVLGSGKTEIKLSQTFVYLASEETQIVKKQVKYIECSMMIHAREKIKQVKGIKISWVGVGVVGWQLQNFNF